MGNGTQPIHLLTNTASGSGDAGETRERAIEAIESRGLRPIVLTAGTAQETTAVALAAVRSGAGRLVVIGGDGALHHVLPAVVRSSATLGVVPVGTGNDFARAFGIGTDDLDSAIDTALGPARMVDVLRVGQRWAATVATIGFSVDVNKRAERSRLRLGGAIYTVATLQALPRLRSRTLRLVLDETPLEVDAVLAAFGNTAWFGGGMQICPTAGANDGQIHVTIIGAVGRATLLRALRSVFDGSHVDRPEVTTHRARRVTIATDVGELWADGERIGPTPTTIEIVPKSLRLAARVPTTDQPID